MLPTTAETILAKTGAQKINNSTVFQSLWRCFGDTHASVILKHIKLPDPGNHPRGWNTGLSHQRKI